MYAIGGSANPTINSQGNVFIASDDESTKEVYFASCTSVTILKLTNYY